MHAVFPQVKRLITLLLILLLPCTYLAAAEPLLDSINTELVREQARIQILFTSPIQYLQHYPSSSTRLLSIKLQIPASGVQYMPQSLGAADADRIGLKEVRFDPDGADVPVLRLEFTRLVSFQVNAAGDNRSITVTLPYTAPAQPEARDSGPARPDPAALDTGTAAGSLPIAPGLLDTQEPVASTPSKPEPVDPARYPYTINLSSTTSEQALPDPAQHPLLQDHYLYRATASLQGKTWHRIRLGYYKDIQEARQALQALAQLYPQAWVDLSDASDAPRIQAWVRGMRAAEPATMIIDTDTAELAQLMNQGKQAIAKGRYREAVRMFTKVLTEPKNAYQRDALELLGLARERNQQIAHAVAEYRKYLELYPEGEGSVRVKQRLVALTTARTRPTTTLRSTESAKKAASWQVYGSVFQYYHRDVDTTDPSNSTVTNSSLDTDVSVTARRRDEDMEMRAQFSGTYIYDTMDSGESKFRVSNLYVDAADRKKTLFARLGRQNRSTGGVLGRFDGLAMEYRFAPQWKVAGVAGFPVVLSQSNSVETNKKLYGMSIERESLFPNLNASIFAIQQTVDGITDRSAIGAELRYQKKQRTFFTLVDYDVSYQSLNTLLVIGSWRLPDSTTISIIGDYRNSPILTTSNALQGQTVTSIEEMLQTRTEDQVRQLAQDRTAKYGSASFSISRPLKTDLLINGDITVANTGSTPASGGVEAIPGTGYEYYYSAQLVSSNFFKSGDTNILGVRYADASTSDTWTLTANTRYPINGDWRVNPRLRFDFKDRTDNSEILTIKPSLRIDYRARRNIKLEMEAGYEWSDIKETAGGRTESNAFFSIGYIADF